MFFFLCHNSICIIYYCVYLPTMIVTFVNKNLKFEGLDFIRHNSSIKGILSFMFHLNFVCTCICTCLQCFILLFVVFSFCIEDTGFSHIIKSKCMFVYSVDVEYQAIVLGCWVVLPNILQER